MTMDLSFYKNKKVLVTGHTGFKGTWMCRMLINAGAIVTGYSLEPPTKPSLFELAGIADCMNSVIGDIRDLSRLQAVFDEAKPEIVIHMAAQPIVRESYKNPVFTYETNVIGTVNVLEAVRHCPSVKSVVNVTTDKVYLNVERQEGYREDEILCGFDPYSNSKSCSELVTYSYRNSFFGGELCRREDGAPIAITTCRAGNVIGGGDFAADRIIPDCIRAASINQHIQVRNPNSVRPYQHVLEPVAAYLMIAMKQYDNPMLSGCYNIGPDDCNCVTTGELTTVFCDIWNHFCLGTISYNTYTADSIQEKELKAIEWKCGNTNGPHEANFLRLNCDRIKATFGWQPKWNVENTIEKIVDWTICYLSNGDIIKCMDSQIEEYLG